MKIHDFEIGHAIEYRLQKKQNTIVQKGQGVIVETSNSYILFAPVYPIQRQLPDNEYYDILCYDDKGAGYEHQNNIRLRNCPPPFSKLSKNIKENLYANAGGITCFNQNEIDKYHVTILDGGIKVGMDIIDEILNHALNQSPEKQFTYIHKEDNRQELPEITKKPQNKNKGMELE